MTTQAQILSDTIPVTSLAKAVGGQQSPKPRLGADFWSTSERAMADTTRDIMQVRYNGPHLINYVTFEVAHFPHTATVEYLDDATGAWMPVIDLLGNPLSHSISDSLPKQIRPFGAGSTTVHPQHYGRGHWIALSWHIQKITAAQLRIVLVRQPGVAPVDVTTLYPIPYSLGVRRADIGYRIYSQSDLPRTGLISSPDDVIASSSDYLGSRVDYSVRFLDPENALETAVGHQPWRSAPQPLSYAVVNYYTDVRDNDGNAQTVDRFELAPLTPGPHMTIYYSNDTPDSPFVADDTPLVSPVLDMTGTPIASTYTLTPEFLDLSSDTEETYVDIDRRALQWDATQPWWVGVEIMPQYDLSNDDNDCPVIDFAGMILRFYEGEAQAILPDGTVLGFEMPATPINTTVSMVLAYNPVASADFGEGFLFVIQQGDENLAFGGLGSVASGGVVITSTGSDDSDAIYGEGIYGEDIYSPSTSDGSPTTLSSYNLRVGAFNADPSIPSLMRLSALVLKQEALTREGLGTFLANPQAAVLKPDPQAVAVDPTMNALLRFHPSGISADYPAGFVGGPGQVFEALTWTPVARDYTLKAGFAHLPPTRAKFFKFEFTNLVPEQYEVFVPITTQVKFFPAQVVAACQIDSTWTPQNAGPGWSAQTNINPINRYYDALGLLVAYASSAAAPSAYSPTSMLVATDAQTSDQISGLGWVWDFDPWQVGVDAPRFSATSVHVYDIVTITRKTKTAYFVGIDFIRPYRVSHALGHDRARYFEPFYETGAYDSDTDPASMVETLDGFTMNGTEMVTEDGTDAIFAEAVSRVMPSISDVRGIQYATTQTEAYQILPDDQLLDIADNWVPYGDAMIDQLGLGGAVVQRGLVRNTYEALEQLDVPTEGVTDYSDLEALGDWGNVEGGLVVDGAFGGGIQSQPFAPSSSGRIYGAVKVSASQPLNAPIIVQLISVDADLVLSQQTYTPSIGETVAIITTYTVGNASTLLQWADMEGTNIGETVNTYGDLESTTYGSHETNPIGGDVILRIYQEGETTDTFVVQQASVFDDAVVWEFSVDGGTTFFAAPDIRNDPNGVMLFDTPGNELVWRVRAYRAGVHISALAVRPWYGGMLSGVLPKNGVAQGPNRNLVDDYPPIVNDPMFQQWHSAVPREWYDLSLVDTPPVEQSVGV